MKLCVVIGTAMLLAGHSVHGTTRQTGTDRPITDDHRGED